MIDVIAFDGEQRVLTVTFRETGRYVYYEVPGPVFSAFCDAPSAGTFFNEKIKGRFRWRRDPERRRFGPMADRAQ